MKMTREHIWNIGRMTGILLLSGLLAAGCSQSREEVVTAGCKATGDRFFGLCDFMNDRIEEYTSAGYTVNKTVSLNDNSESLQAMEVNWKTELLPLSSAYINRSAWLDKFVVDTAATDDGFRVRYTSHRASIPIKELEVRFTGRGPEAAVALIKVKSARKNLLYTSNQEIEFAPDSYYTVKGKQRTLFLSRTEFGVHSEIVTGN